MGTVTNLIQNGRVNTIHKLDDGSVLLGGTFTDVGAGNYHKLVKVKNDGSLDTEFCGNVQTVYGGSYTLVNEVFIVRSQASGKIIVGQNGGGQALMVLNSNGTLDTGNFANSATSGNPPEMGVYAIQVFGDDSFVVGGNVLVSYGGGSINQGGYFLADGTGVQKSAMAMNDEPLRFQQGDGKKIWAYMANGQFRLVDVENDSQITIGAVTGPAISSFYEGGFRVVNPETPIAASTDWVVYANNGDHTQKWTYASNAWVADTGFNANSDYMMNAFKCSNIIMSPTGTPISIGGLNIVNGGDGRVQEQTTGGEAANTYLTALYGVGNANVNGWYSDAFITGDDDSLYVVGSFTDWRGEADGDRVWCQGDDFGSASTGGGDILTIPSVSKGSGATIELDVDSLAALAPISGDSFFSNTSVWKSVSIVYKSPTRSQYEGVVFDPQEVTPTGTFDVSSYFVGATAEVQMVIIKDFDGGRLVVNRSELDETAFDITFS